MQVHCFDFRALATDYDGTLTEQQHVDARTIAALQRVRASGRRLILVTGREVNALMRALPEYPLFDLIVAENGALLYRPDKDETIALAKSPIPCVNTSGTTPRKRPKRTEAMPRATEG
jgi:hydroxymethylpyrimidine pyrophosphatase-like HAD family hydrolase